MAKTKPSDPRIQIIQNLSHDIVKCLEDRQTKSKQDYKDIEKLRRKVTARRRSEDAKIQKGQLITKSADQREVEKEEEARLELYVSSKKWEERISRWKEGSTLLQRVLDDPELESGALGAWMKWSDKHYDDIDPVDDLGVTPNLVVQHHREVFTYIWNGHVVPRLEGVLAAERKSPKKRDVRAGTSVDTFREKVVEYLEKVEVFVSPLLNAMITILSEDLFEDAGDQKNCHASHVKWASHLIVILEDDTATEIASSMLRGKISTLLHLAIVSAALVDGGIEEFKDMKVLGFTRLSNLLMQSRSAIVSLNLLKIMVCMLPETKGGNELEQAVNKVFPKDVWPREWIARILPVVKIELRGSTTKPAFYSSAVTAIFHLPTDPSDPRNRPCSTTLHSLLVDGIELLDEEIKKSPQSGPRLYLDPDMILVTYIHEDSQSIERSLDMASVSEFRVTNKPEGLSVFSFKARSHGNPKLRQNSATKDIQIGIQGSAARNFAQQMQIWLKPEQQDPSFKGAQSVPTLKSQAGRLQNTPGRSTDSGRLSDNVKAVSAPTDEDSRRNQITLNGNRRASLPESSEFSQKQPSHISGTDASSNESKEKDGDDIRPRGKLVGPVKALEVEHRGETSKIDGGGIIQSRSNDIIIPESSTSTSNPSNPPPSKPRTPLGMRHPNKPPSVKSTRSKQRSDTGSADALAPKVSEAPPRTNIRRGSVAPGQSRDDTPSKVPLGGKTGATRDERAAMRAGKGRPSLTEVVEEEEEGEDDENNENDEEIKADAEQKVAQVVDGLEADREEDTERDSANQVYGLDKRKGKEKEVVEEPTDEPPKGSQQLRKSLPNKASVSLKKYGKSKEPPRYKIDPISDEEEEADAGIPETQVLDPTSPASPDVPPVATSKALAPFKPPLSKIITAANAIAKDTVQDGRREWSEPVRADPLKRLKTAPDQLQHDPQTNFMASPDKHAINEDLRAGKEQPTGPVVRGPATANQPTNPTSKKTIVKPSKPAEDDVFTQSSGKEKVRKDAVDRGKKAVENTETEEPSSDDVIAETISKVLPDRPKRSAKVVKQKLEEKPFVQPKPKSAPTQERVRESRSGLQSTPVPDDRAAESVLETQQHSRQADKGKGRVSEQKKIVEKEAKTGLPRRGAAVRAEEALEETYQSDGGEKGKVDEEMLEGEEEDGEQQEEPEPEVVPKSASTSKEPKPKTKSETPARSPKLQVVVPKAKSRLSREIVQQPDDDEGQGAGMIDASEVDGNQGESQEDNEASDDDNQNPPSPVKARVAQVPQKRQAQVGSDKATKERHQTIKAKTIGVKDSPVQHRRKREYEEEVIEDDDEFPEAEERLDENEASRVEDERDDEDIEDDQEMNVAPPVASPPVKKKNVKVLARQSSVETDEDNRSAKRVKTGAPMQLRQGHPASQPSNKPSQSIKPVVRPKETIIASKPLVSPRSRRHETSKERVEDDEPVRKQVQKVDERKDPKTVHTTRTTDSSKHSRGPRVAKLAEVETVKKRKNEVVIEEEKDSRKKTRFKTVGSEEAESTQEIFQILDEINLAVKDRIKSRLNIPSKRQRAAFRGIAHMAIKLTSELNQETKAIWKPIVDGQEKADTQLRHILNGATIVINQAKQKSRDIQVLLSEKVVFELGEGLDNMIE